MPYTTGVVQTNFMPTYDFSGDMVTVLGMIGVVSTLVIVVSVFRSYFRSPVNVRYVAKPVDENSEVYVEDPK
jgi:hypothetical protein